MTNYKEEDDFEDEDLGDNANLEDKIEPFDPKKVDISITTPNLGTLIMRLRHNEIDLMPDFQRSRDLWSKQEQSRLIESILIRLPIPAFYFDAIIEDKWQVVDGLQRLSAISNFAVNKTLHLTNLEFLTDYEGCGYDELPRPLQRRIDEFQTSVYLIKPGTPLEMKYSLFNRINTGGLKLNQQEIRHAMSQSINSGAASSFLQQIVKKEEFILIAKNKNHRMSHEELALRHMTFVLFGVEEYKSSLPKFLNSGMAKLGKLKPQKLKSLQDNFLRSLSIAYKIFGDDSFKKTLAKPTQKKVVNKPLFEAVSVCLASLNEIEATNLIKNKKPFASSFKALLEDPHFDIAISKSTANTDNVQTRFKKTFEIVKKFTVKEQ